MLGRVVRSGLVAVVLVVACCGATASAAPTDTIRVSVDTGSRWVNGSFQARISDDGTLVVFTTRIGFPNDYSRYNVMLRNLVSNETTLLSSTAAGTPPQYRDSRDGAISGDGRTAAFMSDAGLVDPSTDRVANIFVRDIATGAMSGGSVSSTGQWSNGPCGLPTLSSDGRYVAFTSDGTNLVPGDTNRATDIFVRDRQSGTTQRVSVSTAGVQGNDNCSGPVISRNGRYVAFASFATNLVSGDTNNRQDIFVRDLVAQTTSRVSVTSAGLQADGTNWGPSISSDGRYVAFTSYSQKLVPNDTNVFKDVFVRDRVARTTTRVSISSTEAQANGSSWWCSISGDGRYVAFDSGASNLAPADANAARQDIYVRDRTAGTTWRASVSSVGQQATSNSTYPALSASGAYVAFTSEGSNLVPYDTNEVTDVFWRRALLKPASLSLKTSDQYATYGQTVKLSGTLYGIPWTQPGRKVWLQVSADKQTWSNVTSRITASNGSFGFSLRVTKSAYYRVVYSGGNGLSAGASPTIRQWLTK
jgi:hypothetical protein